MPGVPGTGSEPEVSHRWLRPGETLRKARVSDALQCQKPLFVPMAA